MSIRDGIDGLMFFVNQINELLDAWEDSKELLSSLKITTLCLKQLLADRSAIFQESKTQKALSNQLEKILSTIKKLRESYVPTSNTNTWTTKMANFFNAKKTLKTLRGLEDSIKKSFSVIGKENLQRLVLTITEQVQRSQSSSHISHEPAREFWAKYFDKSWFSGALKTALGEKDTTLFLEVFSMMVKDLDSDSSGDITVFEYSEYTSNATIIEKYKETKSLYEAKLKEDAAKSEPLNIEPEKLELYEGKQSEEDNVFKEPPVFPVHPYGFDLDHSSSVLVGSHSELKSLEDLITIPGNGCNLNAMLDTVRDYLPGPQGMAVETFSLIVDAVRRGLPVAEITKQFEQPYATFCSRDLVVALLDIMENSACSKFATMLQKGGFSIPFIRLSPKTKQFCVGLSDLSFVLRGKHPMLFSFGQSQIGKSSLLNAVFGTKFLATSNPSPYHTGSLDISAAKDSVFFHIADLHGEEEDLRLIVDAFAPASSIFMLHVMLKNAVEENMLSLIQSIHALQSCSVIFLVLRDCTASTKRDPLYEKLKCTLQQFTKVHLLCINKVANPTEEPTEAALTTFKREIWTRILSSRQDFVSNADRADIFNMASTLKGLAKAGFDIKELSAAQIVVHLNMKKELAKHYAEENKIAFPRSDLHKEKERVEAEILALRQSDSAIELAKISALEERFAKAHSDISSAVLPLHPTTKLFLTYILQYPVPATMEMSLLLEEQTISRVRPQKEKMNALLEEQSKLSNPDALKALDASMVECLQTIDKYTTSVEHYWRELIYHVTDTKRYFTEVVTAFTECLKSGLPMEIINGDTRSISIEFLRAVISEFSTKVAQPYIISIVGPQSSAKSTLLNYLFGSQFQVSAGRCTKGLYATYVPLVDTEGRKDILVLDSEGLFSIEKRDPKFDQQLMLLIMSASNSVIINVQGEINTAMLSALEVNVLCLDKLKIVVNQPTVMFVLRDIIDRDKSSQQEKIKNIRQSLTELCNKLKVELPIKVDDDKFFLMSAAYKEVPLDRTNKIIVKQPAEAFADQAAELRELLLSGRDTQKPFGTLQWINRVEGTWDQARQFKDMVNLSTALEYFERKSLTNITGQLIETYIDNSFVKDCINQIHQIQDTKNSAINEQEKIIDEQIDTAAIQTSAKIKAAFLEKLAVQREEDITSLQMEYLKSLQRRMTKVQQEQKEILANRVARFKQNGLLDSLLTQIIERAEELRTVPNPNIDQEFEKIYTSVTANIHERYATLYSDSPQIISVLTEAWAVFHKANIDLERTKYTPEFKQISVHWKKFIQSRERKGWFIKALDMFQSDKNKEFIIPILTSLKQRAKQLAQETTTEERITTARIQTCFQTLVQYMRSTDEMLKEKFQVELNTTFQNMLMDFTLEALTACWQERYTTEHINFTEQLHITKEVALASFREVLLGFNSDQDVGFALVKKWIPNLQRIILNKLEDSAAMELKAQSKMTPTELARLCQVSAFIAQDDAAIFEFVTDPASYSTKMIRRKFDRVLNQITAKYSELYQKDLQQSLTRLINLIKDWKTAFSKEVETAVMKKRNQLPLAMHFIDYITGKNVDNKILGLPLTLPLAVAPFKEEQFMSGLYISSLRVSSPSVFADAIITKLNQFMIGTSTFTIPAEDAIWVACKTEALGKTIPLIKLTSPGCPRSCPFCNQRCTVEGFHTKHQTEYHILNGFGGCSTLHTRTVLLNNCQDSSTHTRLWGHLENDGKVDKLPFPQFVAKYYQDWNIPAVGDIATTIEQKKAWWRIRHKICEHYGIKDNTPSDWGKL